MSRPNSSKSSNEDLDYHWSIVKESLLSMLNGSKPSSVEVMNAYSSAYTLETNAMPVRYARPDGTSVHGVRVRVVKVIREYCQINGEEEESAFRDKWSLAARNIFSYHDRHYAKRQAEEHRAPRPLPPDLVFPDDGTTSMFQLGMAVWKKENEN